MLLRACAGVRARDRDPASQVEESSRACRRMSVACHWRSSERSQQLPGPIVGQEGIEVVCQAWES